MREQVTVFGAGYVGLVSGVCLAADGWPVRVLDVDEAKLDTLRAGHSPFFEPGLDDLMRESVAQETLEFALTSEIQSVSSIVMIAVGTPATSTGSADMRYVRSVLEVLEQHAEAGPIAIMQSTVPPRHRHALCGTLGGSRHHVRVKPRVPARGRRRVRRTQCALCR